MSHICCVWRKAIGSETRRHQLQPRMEAMEMIQRCRLHSGRQRRLRRPIGADFLLLNQIGQRTSRHVPWVKTWNNIDTLTQHGQLPMANVSNRSTCYIHYLPPCSRLLSRCTWVIRFLWKNTFGDNWQRIFIGQMPFTNIVNAWKETHILYTQTHYLMAYILLNIRHLST